MVFSFHCPCIGISRLDLIYYITCEITKALSIEFDYVVSVRSIPGPSISDVALVTTAWTVLN